MLVCETVYKVTQWFEKRDKGELPGSRGWEILRLVFLKEPDAKLEKGL